MTPDPVEQPTDPLPIANTVIPVRSHFALAPVVFRFEVSRIDRAPEVWQWVHAVASASVTIAFLRGTLCAGQERVYVGPTH